MTSPMTYHELRELDRLLVKFAAQVLNEPYTGKNDDTKREHLFRRITSVRLAIDRVKGGG